jgi:hypothetical protein
MPAIELNYGRGAINFDYGAERFEVLLGRVAAARSALHDDAAFDLEWNRGRAMTPEQVMQFALNVGTHSE